MSFPRRGCVTIKQLLVLDMKFPFALSLSKGFYERRIHTLRQAQDMLRLSSARTVLFYLHCDTVYQSGISPAVMNIPNHPVWALKESIARKRLPDMSGSLTQTKRFPFSRLCHNVIDTFRLRSAICRYPLRVKFPNRSRREHYSIVTQSVQGNDTWVCFL